MNFKYHSFEFVVTPSVLAYIAVILLGLTVFVARILANSIGE